MTAKQMEWAMRRKERGLEQGVQRGLQRMLVLNKPLADEWKAFLRKKTQRQECSRHVSIQWDRLAKTEAHKERRRSQTSCGPMRAQSTCALTRFPQTSGI